MATENAKPSIKFRKASREDLPDIVELLSQRDGARLDPDAVAGELLGLDPERFVGWIATVDDIPAGMTSLILRSVHSDGESPRTLRAGYWVNLFVGEPYRKLMIYPSLVFAMAKGMRELELDMIFSGIRQPHVLEGHLKLGYRLVGTVPVLMRPLRPFRLVARQKRLGSLAQSASALPDGAWGTWLSIRGTAPPLGVRLEEVDLSDPRIEQLVALMNNRAKGLIGQAWTTDYFRTRFTMATDGERYTAQLALRDEKVIGGTIHRLAYRGHGVRTGVVLDLILAPGEDDAGRALLSHAEQRMRADGADIVLFLDGVDEAVHQVFRSRGYRTAPDAYSMVVSPKNVIEENSWEDTITNWLFTFSDHDAF